jgi:pilus assembly protein CpaE
MSETDKIFHYFNDPVRTPQPTAGSESMTAHMHQSIDSPYSESFSTEALSIALFGPEELTRRTAADALRKGRGNEIREFDAYPADLDEVPKLLDQQFDVIIIDLDPNPEYALELVESLCANGAATVMVFSSKPDSELLVRCMRAGAREFLTPPFAQATMTEALVRAAARRPASRTQKKTRGKLLVFQGAKGGAGVTTVACNFAVALAKDSGQSTLLIDLDLPLGDAALNLGIIAEYSTITALLDTTRLDVALLEKLIVKHSSGVWVLAAPGKFPTINASNEAIDKLISVARLGFDNVVVDVGSKFDSTGTVLYREATAIYLVTQAGIPELRNSNRLISQYFPAGDKKLEVVLNRYEPKALGVTDEHITKALTRPAQWKIPNDYPAVRRMQNTATPLIAVDSPISRIIKKMARTVSGVAEAEPKKKGFKLFGK